MNGEARNLAGVQCFCSPPQRQRTRCQHGESMPARRQQGPIHGPALGGAWGSENSEPSTVQTKRAGVTYLQSEKLFVTQKHFTHFASSRCQAVCSTGHGELGLR